MGLNSIHVLELGPQGVHACQDRRIFFANGKEFLYIDLAAGGRSRLVWILDWTELVRAMATGR